MKIDNIGLAVRNAAVIADFFALNAGFVVSRSEGSATIECDGSYIYVFETENASAGLAPHDPDLVNSRPGLDTSASVWTMSMRRISR